MQSKICTKCNTEKNLSGFGRDSRKKDDLQSQCSQCDYDRNLKWYRKNGKRYYAKYIKTEERKEYMKECAKKHRDTYPDKCKARSSVSNAIQSGRLIKQPCHCGESEVEAHHEDYSKPLDVQWLCVKHHKELHRKERVCVS